VLYRVLANLVLALHVAFVAFAILGGLLALRWRWIPWLHLPAVLWGAVVEFTGWTCPLTPLENSLRRAGSSQVYSGDFVQHYLSPLLYSTTLTRSDQISYGLGLLLINAAIYGFLFHRLHRARLAAQAAAAGRPPASSP